jgi:hypothetical protein
MDWVSFMGSELPFFDFYTPRSLYAVAMQPDERRIKTGVGQPWLISSAGIVAVGAVCRRHGAVAD